MRGLAARILPRVVFPTLIAGVLFGAGDWYLSREAALEKANEDLKGATSVAAEFMREDLRGVERAADVILGLEVLENYFIYAAAEMQDEAEYARLDLEAAAFRLTDTHADILSFELFDSTGTRFIAVVEGKRTLAPLDAKGIDWFDAAPTDGTWRAFPNGGQLRITRSQPSRYGLDQIVTSVTVSTEVVLARAMALLDFWQDGAFVELYGPQGKALFSSGEEPTGSTIRVDLPLVELGGELAVSLDSKLVENEVWAQKLTTGMLLLVLCGSLTVLLVLVVRKVVLAPLLGLNELADAFRRDLELPTSIIHETREIASLDLALRAAAEEARSSARALANMNTELEQRVKLRTGDLERMRDQALNASRAKSQFLANMSHEIRTPMNGVLGMAEILGSTELDEEQASYLDVIRRSGDSLLGVINDILDFSKIEAGKIDLEEVDFELVSSVHDVATLLAERAEQKGVELVFDADPRLPSHVIGDPARLRQVLTNLVGNAIKFTDEGTVQLRVRLSQGDGLQVEFQVKDSGIGIPQVALESIFESFSQADVSTTRKFGGTGLGLTISRKLVQLMGGELEVTSVVGEGSDFKFVLPLKESRQASSDCEAAELLAGRRVLVVDDNESNRRILMRQFKAIGVETVRVEDGLQALQTVNEEWAEGRSFDFAILDYQMPHMSGVELADRLAPLCKKSGMQLLLLSSATVLERGHEKSIARRLTKPVRADLLFTALAGLLPEGSRPITPRPVVPATSQANLSGCKGDRVLLAEDNRVNQLVATKLLEGLGFQVDLAENGQAALEMATERTYPLILMDCQMPVMDGYRATAEIKLVRPEQLIIAMTANAMQGDREKCLAAGMDDYITKPIRREVLVETLRRHLLTPPRT